MVEKGDDQEAGKEVNKVMGEEISVLTSNLPLACVPPAWPPLHLGKLMEILSVSDLPTSGPTAQMLRFPEMKGLVGLFECIV